jgi:Zn-dependent peptidase ImmA (M78 family)
MGLGSSLDEMRDASTWLLARIGGLTEEARDAVLGVHGESSLVLQPFPAALMFGATSPQLSNEDRLTLLNCMSEAAVRPKRYQIDNLMFDVPLDIEKPWDQADTMAEIALEELEIDAADAAVDLDELLGRLGVHLGDITLDDDSIRAVAIGGERFRSSIYVNTIHPSNQTGQGRRFTLAHELCHLLFDRGLARSVVMPSGPWAPLDVEKRANAFAAMFLMPRDRIRAFIAGSPETIAAGDLVNAVAKRFDTSFTATLQHLHNLSILSESERDALLDLLGG